LVAALTADGAQRDPLKDRPTNESPSIKERTHQAPY